MQSNNTSLNSCLTLILFSFVGIILGLISGLIAAGIENSPQSSKWILLDGSQKFKSIADVTSQMVWAQSEDGKLYSWNYICYGDIPCKQWVEATEIPSNIHEAGESPMKKSTSCKTLSSSSIKSPPGSVIECASGQFAGPEYGQVTYYALLEDGNIWVLRTSSSLIVAMVLPIIYAFGGLVLSFIGFIVFAVWRKIKENRSGQIASMSSSSQNK